MQVTAAKHAEALAHDIADTLNVAPTIGARATFDHDANTWAVALTRNGHRYDLLMPAPGAHYSLFRDGAWCGGINLRSDANPSDATAALLGRIACVDPTPGPDRDTFRARLITEGMDMAADPNYFN